MLGGLALLSLAQPPSRPTQPVLCPNSDGAIIGLASDNTYFVRPPADGGTAGSNPERWQPVQENHATPQTGPINSFTGSFMQVLPDDRDSYHNIFGLGSFTMTGLDFAFRVTTPGLYTLFLRWTGGDTVGGGDSLYAVVRRAGSDELMTGPDAYKPAQIPIDQNPGQFTGCCYNPVTHACPCYTPAMDPNGDGSACSAAAPAGAGGHWVPTAQTARWHPMCDDVNGQQTLIQSPRWFLYAGQEAGNVMDFASEPWDFTCEAEGTGTADTGLDHAQWNLQPGTYHMVFYPREDGTAVDAFYLAPPGGASPTAMTVLTAGSSTTCTTGATTTPTHDSTTAAIHQHGDWHGWGHRGQHTGGSSDPNAPVGGVCGLCLVPLNPNCPAGDNSPECGACPLPEVLNTMQTCDNVQEGQLCEADGECGTDVRTNNCENNTPDPAVTDPNSPRSRGNRNNDVYKRVPCADAARITHQTGHVDANGQLEPTPPPPPLWPHDEVEGGGANGGVVFLIIFLLLLVFGGLGFWIYLSKKQNNGLIVAPWKLKLGTKRAQTSTTTVDIGGVGPLATQGVVNPFGASGEAGGATGYVAAKI